VPKDCDTIVFFIFIDLSSRLNFVKAVKDR